MYICRFYVYLSICIKYEVWGGWGDLNKGYIEITEDLSKKTLRTIFFIIFS